MRFLAALALVATVAVAGGVGASPTGAAGAAARPASCKLLKTGDVTAAMGQPAGPGNAGPVPEVCAWPLFATSDHAAGSIYVFLERGSKVKQDYVLASDFNVDDRERLTGLGRRAFYAPSLGTVWVLEDASTLFYVQGVYPRDLTPEAGALQAALVQLAKQAEARL